MAKPGRPPKNFWRKLKRAFLNTVDTVLKYIAKHLQAWPQWLNSDYIYDYIDAHLDERLSWLTEDYLDKKIRRLLSHSSIRAFESQFIGLRLEVDEVILERQDSGYLSMVFDVSTLGNAEVEARIYGQVLDEKDEFVWRLDNVLTLFYRQSADRVFPQLMKFSDEYYHNGVRVVVRQKNGLSGTPLYCEWFWK